MAEAPVEALPKSKKQVVAENPETQEKGRKKRNWRKTLAPEEKTRQKSRLVENEARKALKAVVQSEAAEAPQRVENLSAEELVSEYDRWMHLSDRLQASDNEELRQAVERQAQDIKRELLLKGITADLPRHELATLADMPVSYSADLLNNLTQGALGVAIVGDSVSGEITTTGKTIHVPKGPLTLEATVRIAEEITRTNPELLRERAGEVLKFGQDIRDLARYLAGQTTDVGESIFTTPEQQEAIIALYNAGVWLEKIGNRESSQERIASWDALEESGKAFVGDLHASGKAGAARQADILEFFFGKTIAQGRLPTTYQRLLEKHGGTEADLRAFLAGPNGQKLVRRLAPFIAESFSEGKAARAIARGARKIEEATPQVVFEAAREQTKTHARVALPPEVEERLRAQYGDAVIPDTRNLFAAARQIVAAGGSRQQQLAALNDLVRHYQIPGEVAGSTIAGYQLAQVYDNPNAEIGCAVRAYLLASALEDAYGDLPEAERPSVVANTLLVRRDDGSVMGHTRLQVIVQKGDAAEVYTVDPSVMSYMQSGVTRVADEAVVEQIVRAGKTGASIEVAGESDSLSQHQWVGDVFSSQEANMLVNLSQFANTQDEQQLLQMALRQDPNNEIALVRLAALSEDGSTERAAYTAKLLHINPAFEESSELAAVLAAASEKKIGVELARNTFREPRLNAIIARFYATPLEVPDPPNAPIAIRIPPGMDLEDLLLMPPRNAPDGYEMAVLQALRNLRQQLNNELERMRVGGARSYIADNADFQDLLNPATGELGATFARAERDIRVNLWEQVQVRLTELERDASRTTGYGSALEGNYQISNEIVVLLGQMRRQGVATDAFLTQLEAEVRVRTAAHDVFVTATLEGDSGAQKMQIYGNRMTASDYMRTEALPGVARVKAMWEEEENRVLAMQGGLKLSDFDAIGRRIEARLQREITRGLVTLMYNPTTPQGRLEIARALAVGKNLHIFKNRDAHFIAMGDPTIMGGYGIGNIRLDFIVKAFAPWKWFIGRYGLAAPEAAPIIKQIGEDEINSMLYLQDHDSSIWRVPEFIKALRDKGLVRQGLFMRLYWLGETSRSPGQTTGGIGGEAEYTGTAEQLAAERLSLVRDIITYEPDQLASVFANFPDMRAILDRGNFEQFMEEISFLRQDYIARGQYDFPGWNRAVRRMSAGSRRMYKDLTKFLGKYEENLADPTWKFSYRKYNFAEGKFGGKETMTNPLFRHRVYSNADLPFNLLDGQWSSVGGEPEFTVSKDLADALGGQDMGRELGNVGDATKAASGLVAFFRDPKFEAIAKMTGTIVAYKGNAQDIYVRDKLTDATIRYVQEDPGLRALLPGLDVLVGRLQGGGSIAQREKGKYAEAYDTIDLLQTIDSLAAAGTISASKAAELRDMVTSIGPLLEVLRIFPQVQLLVFVALVSVIRMLIDTKGLAPAA